VAPDAFDIIDVGVVKGLTNDQRRNLGSVAKILQFAASNKGVSSCSSSSGGGGGGSCSSIYNTCSSYDSAASNKGMSSSACRRSSSSGCTSSGGGGGSCNTVHSTYKPVRYMHDPLISTLCMQNRLKSS